MHLFTKHSLATKLQNRLLQTSCFASLHTPLEGLSRVSVGFAPNKLHDRLSRHDRLLRNASVERVGQARLLPDLRLVRTAKDVRKGNVSLTGMLSVSSNAVWITGTHGSEMTRERLDALSAVVRTEEARGRHAHICGSRSADLGVIDSREHVQVQTRSRSP